MTRRKNGVIYCTPGYDRDLLYTDDNLILNQVLECCFVLLAIGSVQKRRVVTT